MSQQILTISRASLLDSLQIHQEGELAYAVDVEKYYVYQNGSWMEIEVEGAPSKQEMRMTVYDMNKQVIKQLPSFDETRIKDAMETLLAWKKPNVNLYMLYGKEISYFTLFEIIGYNDFGNDVIDCCTNIGPIKAMDLTEAGDAIEIWVEIEDGPTCLYLFPYDGGIVRVGE